MAFLHMTHVCFLWIELISSSLVYLSLQVIRWQSIMEGVWHSCGSPSSLNVPYTYKNIFYLYMGRFPSKKMEKFMTCVSRSIRMG